MSQKLLAAVLAVSLAGLGLFVRSEEAHDRFHQKAGDSHNHHGSGHPHHSHGHGHSHEHHSHEHDAPQRPGKHEHTNPLIDVLAEERLIAASTVIPDLEIQTIAERLPPLRLSIIHTRKPFATPPGRAPPSRFFFPA